MVPGRAAFTDASAPVGLLTRKMVRPYPPASPAERVKKSLQLSALGAQLIALQPPVELFNRAGRHSGKLLARGYGRLAAFHATGAPFSSCKQTLRCWAHPNLPTALRAGKQPRPIHMRLMGQHADNVMVPLRLFGLSGFLSHRVSPIVAPARRPEAA